MRHDLQLSSWEKYSYAATDRLLAAIQNHDHAGARLALSQDADHDALVYHHRVASSTRCKYPPQWASLMYYAGRSRRLRALLTRYEQARRQGLRPLP